MKKYPLIEMKNLLNVALRDTKNVEIEKSNIGNYTQFLIVKYMIDHDGEDIYQKDFEAALNIRKSTISGILDTMEKNKIIVRLSSETDGRGKIIKFSDDFENCKRQMMENMRKVEERIIRGISEEELEIFYGVIDKMKKNIEKEGNANV